MIKYFLLFYLLLPTSVYAVDPSINVGCDYGVILSSSSASWQWGASNYYCSILYNCDGSYTLGPAACRPYAYDARVLDFQCTSTGWSLLSDRGTDDHFKDIYANGGGGWIWRDYSHANDSVSEIIALLPVCQETPPEPECPPGGRTFETVVTACSGNVMYVAPGYDAENCQGSCLPCSAVYSDLTTVTPCQNNPMTQFACEQDLPTSPQNLTVLYNCILPDPTPDQVCNDKVEECFSSINLGSFKSIDCEYGVMRGACEVFGNCDAPTSACLNQCSNSNIIQFHCDPKTGIVDEECLCAEEPNEIVSDPSDEHGTPDSTPNNDPQQSSPTDTLEESNAKVVDNTADVVNNTSNIVNNTSLIQQTLDDELNQSNENLVKINDNLKAINTTLTNTTFDDSKNEYKHSNIDGLYDSPISDISQYNTRFTTFVDDIKSTPLFSLPNQILFNIPNSNESSYIINMGSYGDFDFDLADYSTVLITLRSILIICFSFVGIRIALLNR